MAIKISVYITTQNRPQFLNRALNSLLHQSFKNFEVLICNDCSRAEFSNEYKNIIDKFEGEFESLIYLENDKVEGACFSRNRLINIAKGDFITGLDDDDYFHKDRLKHFIEFENIEKYSFLSSSLSSVIDKIDHELNIHSGNEITFESLKNSNVIGNQIFVSKEKLISVGGFDVQMPAWQDYDTWFRLTKVFGPSFKFEQVTMYLDNDDSRDRITTSSKAHQGYKRFILKHSSDLNYANLISLKYIDLINRRQNFNIFSRDLLANPKILLRSAKYQSVYRFPKLYQFYAKFLRKS
ncbi:glycosyltransferase [Tatumella sp. OPLPL6]|uniref:glycosyltransferase n=1 Tax=Tatumella sp. OPLPL6 TaxID=1928657 RepID=UPI000C1A5CE8|nr:glycosyltransferase [Tatumella sp. OPLPL6]PIJ42149.1 hypothetical protein BOM24_13070 [Tatumella sp. OPLPL6]